MTQYNNYGELILALINGGDNNITADSFRGVFLDGYAKDSDNYWKNVLEQMHTEGTWLGHWFIRESDFKNNGENINSVVKYITDKIDRDFSLSDFNNSNSHWNNSVQTLIDKYNDYMSINADGEINSAGHIFSVIDIKKADAGNEYSSEHMNNTPHWVKPWENVDNENYKEVRDVDAILPVLNSKNQTQFTREKVVSFLRLIMPKYMRRVEVEDLDRNFWVIAQSLAALCGYLFDDNSPLNDILKRLLDETAQLWENVLYLWVTAALVTQKKKTENTQKIFLPINNSEMQDFLKYDNFQQTKTTDINTIQQRLSYLVEQYPESDLVIVPEVRDSNYKHNYYAKATYVGVIIYNRDNNSWTKKLFNSPVTVDLTNWSRAIGGLRQQGEKYSYSNSWNNGDGGAGLHYAILRPIISQIDNTNITIDFHDVASEIIGNNTYIPCRITGTISSINGLTYNTLTLPTNGKYDVKKGFYLGELISYFKVLNANFAPSINKTWNGSISSATATFTLIGNGQSQTITISYPNTTGTFNSVPAYDSNGNEITYMITENNLGQYWSISSTQYVSYLHQTGSFTNTYNPPQEVSVYFVSIDSWTGVTYTTSSGAIDAIVNAKDGNNRPYHTYGSPGNEEWYITVPYVVLWDGKEGGGQGYYYDRYYICHNDGTEIEATEVVFSDYHQGIYFEYEVKESLNGFLITGDPSNNYDGYLTNVSDPYSPLGHSRRIAFGGEGSAQIQDTDITINSLYVYHWDMGPGERIDTGSGITYPNRTLSDIQNQVYDGAGYWIFDIKNRTRSSGIKGVS